MELLVGVYHEEKYLKEAQAVIDRRFPGGLESLMLEIPVNLGSIKQNQSEIYHFLRERGFFRQVDFFSHLESVYSKGGARIIYGRLPLDLQPYFPDNESPKLGKLAFSLIWDFLVDTWITQTTDKFMVKTIQEQNPQVVAVGRRHADYIKRRFPNVYYVAFAPSFDIWSRIVGDPKLPDETIKLNY